MGQQTETSIANSAEHSQRRSALIGELAMHDSRVAHNETTNRWNLSTRIAFRFVFAYFTLFNLDDVLGWLSFLGWAPGLRIFMVRHAYQEAWHHVILWVGKDVFQIDRAITDGGWAPADSTHGWLRVFIILVIAAITTVVWSLADRRRANYDCLQEWLRLLLRLTLCLALINYGMAKVIKVQFPDPSLCTLQMPVARLTPMALLWTFMGYSREYCLFGGLAEVVPALLLLVPRLTLLGALLSAAVMTNVFLLNVCFDVWVKLYSLHLLLMALVLIGPDVPRLFRLLILNRPVESRLPPRFSKQTWLNVLVLILPFATGGYALWQGASTDLRMTKLQEEKPPLYGIWETSEFKLDGKVLPPLETDRVRWHQVIFNEPNQMFVRMMNEFRVMSYFVEVSADQQSLSIGQVKNSSAIADARRFFMSCKPEWVSKNDFKLQEQGKDLVKLKGDFEGRSYEVTLYRVNEKKMTLRNHPFRWITDPEDLRPTLSNK